MSEWSMDELQDWDRKICVLGEALNLDWYPIDYEICDYKEMIGHMAYTGLPTHYRHWSYGKSFDRIQTEYNLGMSGLPYEMIINSDPSISYLMTENPMSTHILTMAHCVGHSDFFKNNRMFAETGADTVIDRFKSDNKIDKNDIITSLNNDMIEDKKNQSTIQPLEEVIKTPKRTVIPRSKKQKEYVKALKTNQIIILFPINNAFIRFFCKSCGSYK